MWLTEPLAPDCRRCVNNSNYKLRTHNFGVEKEMSIMNVRIEPLSIIPKNNELLKYVTDDRCLVTKAYAEIVEDRVKRKERARRMVNEYKNRLVIEKVIFNDPATIVVWRDGSKTVVKADNKEFDPEKGLAMAISKKALGNKGNYYEEFKKWLPKDYGVKPKEVTAKRVVVQVSAEVNGAIDKIRTALGIDDSKPDTCSNCDNECLPYGGHKNVCTGRCKKCCPVDMNSKRYAGPTCKEKCENYKKHFGDVSK